MALTVKSKILLTVLSVVLMFTFFILFYFPARQEQVLLENYNEEIENFANSVALGVKIALTEQNFEGVETAIDFVRDDKRLQFVSLIQSDTVRTPGNDDYTIEKTVFKTFPEEVAVDVGATSNDLFIYKRAPFSTPIMSGEVMLSFSTQEIVDSMEQIRMTSIFASLVVFSIGLGIGYLLARNISGPVLALRDAAKKVGEGDLSQSVTNSSKDEIGELAVAFNKMVRDLNIESALEKIRNRTISMQHSEEWQEVIGILFSQMKQLRFDTRGYRVILHDRDYTYWHYWYYDVKTEHTESYFEAVPDTDFNRIHKEAKKENVSFREYELPEDPETYFSGTPITADRHAHETRKREAILTEEAPLLVSTAFTTHGALETITETSLSPENKELLQRLANVIDQSYTRYFDLQKSEAQALEVIKQASLDRVRGEVASMRSKDDLNKITPLVWRELTTLKVPFIRCGVFIVDEEKEEILSILSAPDGKALGIFSLRIEDTAITKNIFRSWKKEKVYSEHWDKDTFVAWTKRLIELGHIDSQQTYQGASSPPKSLYLHFVPFKQGMLYVGDKEPLLSEHIELVTSLANVFSIAFARYEDFTKLEKAKEEVEDTLSELKSTQSQLVLSEKMASLGELTAGIAHEIQNPLNFVNNFSELSTELIQELNEEIKNGNQEEVSFITNHLKQNLEKIHHHGNRASSIVKGMLEHSRDGNRQKELCDLNKLTDEYLRLAYFGLRAKDQNFEATINVNFDKSLPKVSIIAQDMSRVLLNLINNAFYAISVKAARNEAGYEPRVSVSTEYINRRVEIRIKDNGDGIPEDIVEKIFQPFFTTKPTGKGTGLGLSISYDIVTKGHNGKLSVNTSTGKNGQTETGSEFVIVLPVN